MANKSIRKEAAQSAEARDASAEEPLTENPPTRRRPRSRSAPGENGAPDSGELLRVITDASNLFIAYVDHERRYRFANANYREHFVGGSKEIVGMSARDVLGESYERLEQQIEHVLAGQLAEHESQVTFADGTSRWLSARLIPHTIRGGKVTGFVVVAREVTKRKRAEEALRRSEQRFRTVYDQTPVMMHSTDCEGRLLCVNDYWLKTLGYKRDEVLGRRSISFLTPESAERVEKHDFQKLLDHGSVKDVELQMVRKNGHVIDVMISAIAERDDEGAVSHTLAMAVDLTRRKKAERALRDSQDRLERVLESAMDAIILIDADRTVHFFNSAAQDAFQCTCLQAIGQSFDRFASDELSDMLSRLIVAFHQSGEHQRYLWAPDGLMAVRASGEEFAVEATISEFESGDQELFTIILRDIQDRVRAEEEMRKLQLENVYLREEAGAGRDFEHIIHSGPPMTCVLDDARSVAPTDSTVLIIGETGTGKELIARAIHALSDRNEHAMVTVNCAALPSGLIESELFGHEEGAFTGASSKRIGRFEMADKSTLFLDEVGDLPLELQAKLLRVLQEGTFERVGGTQTINVDVRVIAATNVDLLEEVNERTFREDLYYRLNVFPIRVPPLSERPQDIPLLVNHFVLHYARKMGRDIAPIPATSMETLQAYSWPGNVRELQNVIERAAILCRGTHLDLGDCLPRPAHHASNDGEGTLTLQEVERRHIVDVLNIAGWRVSGEHGAAKMLGLKPTTLEARMKKLGVKRPG